jgi:hypothetical protein
MKNFLLLEQNRQLIFSPQIPFNLVAEQSEAIPKNLTYEKRWPQRESSARGRSAIGGNPYFHLARRRRVTLRVKRVAVGYSKISSNLF